MLVVRDLSLAIKDKIILDHISFSCYPNTLTTLIGSNGAGKTSLFQAIAGYIKFSGTITYNEITLNPRIVGFAHDNLVAYPDLTLKDNINFLLDLYKIKNKNYIKEQAEKLKLESYLNIKLKNLSKGFQQKANLLLTLVSNPEILILDEPNANLDQTHVKELTDFIEDLKKDRIVLISTHHGSDLIDLSEQVIKINSGKIEKILSEKSTLTNFI